MQNMFLGRLTVLSLNHSLGKQCNYGRTYHTCIIPTIAKTTNAYYVWGTNTHVSITFLIHISNRIFLCMWVECCLWGRGRYCTTTFSATVSIFVFVTLHYFNITKSLTNSYLFANSIDPNLWPIFAKTTDSSNRTGHFDFHGKTRVFCTVFFFLFREKDEGNH